MLIEFELFFNSCVSVFAIGTYLYSAAAIDHIKVALNSLCKSAPNRKQLLKKLGKFIARHSYGRQLRTFDSHHNFQFSFWSISFFRLVPDFLDIFGVIFTVVLSWSLVTICGSLLMIQMEIVQFLMAQHKWTYNLKAVELFQQLLDTLCCTCIAYTGQVGIFTAVELCVFFLKFKRFVFICCLFQSKSASHGYNLSVMFILIGQVCYAFGATFISCELGQRTNNGYCDIDAIMGQFDWYLYPNEIQRILPAIIANSQQPVYIKCFGSISCSRETFKKVCSP